MIYYSVYQDEKAWKKSIRTLIPDKIKTERVITSDFEYALPGGMCVGLSFKLSKKTIEQINQEGLSFFEDLTPSEQVTSGSKIDYWKPWQQTPALKNDQKHISLPIGCLENFEIFLKSNDDNIFSDTQKYYTYNKHRGQSILWIYPELQIIVYSNYYN